MEILKQLLRIHFGNPFWIAEKYQLPGYAYVENERWQLTDAGDELVQAELSRMAAIVFPNDKPRR